MAFPGDETLITAAESELGMSLPTAWRLGLIARNGGEFEREGDLWTVAPVRDGTDRKRIVRTANHIGVETKAARLWTSFPQEAVVLAGNGCGDHLIAINGSTSVWFWDHETGEIKELGDISPL